MLFTEDWQRDFKSENQHTCSKLHSKPERLKSRRSIESIFHLHLLSQGPQCMQFSALSSILTSVACQRRWSTAKQVKLPIKSPTCCAWGGKSLSQLFVTSMKEEGEGASKHWGGVFRLVIPGESGLAPGYKIKIPA